MRGAEGNGGPKERGPELVVVGHVGTSIVHAGAASWTSASGSGYAVAATAGTLIGDRVGLVAAVGTDFDLAPLRSRRVRGYGWDGRQWGRLQVRRALWFFPCPDGDDRVDRGPLR